eukprot:620132_1
MSTKTRHRMSVGSDNADRECLREIIKRKINEMISNLIHVEQDMMNDLCSTRYDKKIEAHMLLIREIGQKYIEVIESLFNDHDKVTKSNKFGTYILKSDSKNSTDFLKRDLKNCKFQITNSI